MLDIRQKRIENLQIAALKLMQLISSSLDQDAPQGIFRISANADLIKKQIGEIQNGQLDFQKVDQIGRAALLKAVLRQLREEAGPLLSDEKFENLSQAKRKDPTTYAEEIKNILDKSSDINKKIAFYLFELLKKVNNYASTEMNYTNLSIVIAPNLFTEVQDPMQAIQIMPLQNAIIADVIEKADEIKKPEIQLLGTHYDYEVKDASQNRVHALSATSKGLDDKFKTFKGDHLKSKILNHFKERLEKETTLENIDAIVQELKNTKEYTAIATGQGITTRCFGFLGVQTSSVKAFNDMVAERKNDLKLENSFKLK